MREREILSRSQMKDRANKAVIRQGAAAIKLWLAIFITSKILGFFVGAILSLILSPVVAFLFVGTLCFIFIDCPLMASQFNAGMKLYKHETILVDGAFWGFKNYLHNMGGMFWYNLRAKLWGLVPVYGIIKAYSFWLTPYIICSRPELSAEQAIEMSVKLTEGRKMELFALDLSLIGWLLLDTLSLGILGIAYAKPYIITVGAGYFLEIEENTEGSKKRTIFREDVREEKREEHREEKPENSSFSTVIMTNNRNR